MKRFSVDEKSKILVYLLQHIIGRFLLPVQPIEREFHIAWFTSTKNPCIWLAHHHHHHHHFYFNLDHRCDFIFQYFYFVTAISSLMIVFLIRCLSPSSAAKTTMICLFLTRSPIFWISLRIFQHRECHLYSYLRVKNHRCRYLLTQIQSRS